jgi:hypothetical protein
VNEAAQLVLAAQEDADRGFPAPLDMPFGLGALHEQARQMREE